MKKESAMTLAEFVDAWKETQEKNKAAFLQFKSELEQKEGVILHFVPRPGLTYSLRASHPNQQNKSLFAMIDVIEDSPRWLSVCFYGDMISDPDEQGDFVPEGLLGEDAVCFDVEAWDDRLIAYIATRLDEAWRSATDEK